MLPFDGDSFDAVVSQFGLMFFEDRPLALREMMRVLRPGGHLAVAVWDTLENTPGYTAMAGNKTISWAMGYTFAYSLVNLPVRDGYPPRNQPFCWVNGLETSHLESRNQTSKPPK